MEKSLYEQGRWGMALFIGRGFAAWMHAWAQTTPTREQGRADSSCTTQHSEGLRLSEPVQTQLVSALAGMVMDALCQEVA